MLRDKYSLYIPSASDKYHQTTKIIIKPEHSGYTATLHYKMADKFQFLVGAGLELHDLIIDAIDSVIAPTLDSSGCL